tara:strand:+ start:135 stop:2219 length:2085 start_codon:yes stop_codon:yes gene_type:complete
MEKSLNELINDTKKSLSLKRYDDALISLNLIIKKDTQNLSALSTVGDIYVYKGKFIDAIEIFDKIIQINPELSFIYNNKGFCLLKILKYTESISSFQKAIQYKPDFAEAYNNLGLAFKNVGKNLEAKKNFLDSIKYKKDFFQAYNNLSTITLEENNLEDATKYAKSSIEINQKNIEAYNNLGLIFKKKGDFENSLINFNKVLEINSKYLPTLINIAKSYEELNDNDKALEYFKRTHSIDPDNINSLSSLIYLKLKICDWHDIDNLKKRLFYLCDKFETKIMQPYYSLLLKDDVKLQKIIAEKWSKDYSYKKGIQEFQKSNNENIKVGYFSSDFEKHAVASLLKDLFENHDKNKFELYGFNLSKEFLKNNINKDIIKNFKEFIDCNSKTDEEIRNICYILKIDIAVDLNGYTSGGRPAIFKDKCAPIQINYLGYAGTMGDKSYDYIVADKFVIPEKNEKEYSEKIIFIPNSFFPNSLENKNIESGLTKKDFFLPDDKFIYCCFNNVVKINEKILDIWSKILHSSKNSILWLSIAKGTLQHKNILKEFNNRNIDSSKIFFSEKIEYQKYLERFQLADLFLDTYPYGGHTTSIEALSSGLPILTLQGEAFQSRVSASLLKNLDLDELITSNKEDYIKLAIELYENNEKIKSFKIKLTNQKKLSNIFNNKIYTKNLEKAYFEAQDRFVNQKKIDNIYI